MASRKLDDVEDIMDLNREIKRPEALDKWEADPNYEFTPEELADIQFYEAQFPSNRNYQPLSFEEIHKRMKNDDPSPLDKLDLHQEAMDKAAFEAKKKKPSSRLKRLLGL